MTKRERTKAAKPTGNGRGLTIFRWAWTSFMVAVTSAPFVVNWWNTPAGWRYTWILPPYPQDSFGYMGWAEQAARGAWLFKIKFTALPHSPFLFHPLFLVCGWLSALFSCDLGVVFWLVKAIGVVLFFIVFYRYADYLGLNLRQSITASVLVGVSSGIGLLLHLFGLTGQWAKMSTDFWMPEISTFWALMWNPLFPFSFTLMLLSIFWVDRGTNEDRAGDLWRGGLACGLLALLHPYSTPLIFTFAAVIAVVRQKQKAIGYLFRFFAMSLPFALYMFMLSRLNPLLARHSAAGEMQSPAIIEFVTGLGLPLLFFLAGMIILRSELVKRYWQLALWFFLAFAFAYMPFWFQRKLVFGVHIPVCIGTAITFDLLLSRWFSERSQKWVTIVAAIIFVPLIASTSAQIVIDENKEVRANQTGAYYLNDDTIEGLKVLKAQTNPDDVVLATPETSRFVPAYAGNTVVWGHWAMSVDHKERQAAIARVLDMRSDLTDDERGPEFWRNGIRVIFADGGMKQSMAKFPFLWRNILKDADKLFENDSVVIYRRTE